MSRYKKLLTWALSAALLCTPMRAAENAAAVSAVPGQVQYSGAIAATSGTAGVTFALYAEQSGGNALWMETQNVAVNEAGYFNTLLGAETSGGIPQEIFASGEARWLEVSYTDAQGATVTQPRVLLVSVPYAMKAGDAQTLGGLPVSAFVLNPNALNERVGTTGGLGLNAGDALPATAVAGTGTANKVTKWIDGAGTLGDSLLFDNGLVVGIGTTTPSAALHISLQDASIILGGAGTHSLSVQGTGSNGRLGQDNDGFFFSSDTNGKALKMLTQSNNVLQEWMRITAGGQIGMGTQTPGAALHLSQQDASFLIDGAGTHSIAIQGPGSNGRFGQDGQGMFFASDTNGRDFKFLTNNGALNEHMRITSTGNIGIGTTTPATKLDINGTAKMTAIQITGGTPGVGKVLTSDASGNGTWQTPAGGGGGVSGTGTTNKLPKFSAATTLADSQITDNGTDVTIGVTGGGLAVLASANSASIRGGFSGNSVSAGADGGVIVGGGSAGNLNLVTDNYGFVGGGRNNRAGDNAGTTADRPFALVGGGAGNIASAQSSTIVGGISNLASGISTFIGGGEVNTASGVGATISGGLGNSVTGIKGTISGGGRTDDANAATGNRVTDDFGTVSGGGNNQAGDNAGTTSDAGYATVGGGMNNTASGARAVVSGGNGNTALGVGATVSGGFANFAALTDSTVGGGEVNTAFGIGGTIAGGIGNSVNGNKSTVGGGGRTNDLDSATGNRATDNFTTVAGGGNNQAGNGTAFTSDAPNATVGGGFTNTASGGQSTVSGGDNNTASGLNSTVPGGKENTASGNFSFAAGRQATAAHSGAFVWADSLGVNFASTSNDQFLIRANGGVGINTNSPLSNLHVKNEADDGGSIRVGAPTTTLGVARRVYFGDGNFAFIGENINSDDGVEIKAGAADSIYLNAGTVGVGTETPADKLQVVGDIRVGTATTNGCLKRFDGTAVAGTCSSDIRFKKDIRPLGSLLDRVAKLQPVSYLWRADEFPQKHFGTERVNGLIAQQVEEVLPELVSTDDAGYKAINFSELPLLAIQSIKELKAENDALKAALSQQQASLSAATSKADSQQAEIGELREMLMGLQRQLGTQLSKAATGK